MNSLKIDMHNHDVRSDGHNGLSDFVDEAIKQGLDSCAITNHDIIDRDLKILLKDTNIFIPEAVEISAQNYDLERSLHLTSYSMNFSKDVDNILEATLSGKRIMLKSQVDKLIEFGFNISFDELLDFNLIKGKKIDSLNKYSIAEFLFLDKNVNHTKNILKTYSSDGFNISSFFIQFLKRGGLFFEQFGTKVTDYEPSIDVIGELTTNSNAILSIAHPNFTFMKGVYEFKNEIKYYIDRGVNAIEINSKADKIWIETIIEMKNKYNLILTFGSDCHKIGYIDDKHDTFGNINKLICNELITEEYINFRSKIEK